MERLRFLNFPVYQEAKYLHKEIVIVTKNFPRHFSHLADQSKRAALSPILNLAEGSAKRSDRDFNRYIENALGSISELIACIDVAYFNELISKEIYQKLIQQATSIKNQLGGFSRKLVNKSR